MDTYIIIYALFAVAVAINKTLEQFVNPFDDDPWYVKIGVGLLLGIFWPVLLAKKL